jgi:hypothetical protein
MTARVAVPAGCNDVWGAVAAAVHASRKVLSRALKQAREFWRDRVPHREVGGTIGPQWKIAVIAAAVLTNERSPANTGYGFSHGASGIKNPDRPEWGLAGTRQQTPNGKKRQP